METCVLPIGVQKGWRWCGSSTSCCCLPVRAVCLRMCSICLALPWLGGWLGLLQVKAQQEKMGRTPGLDPDDDDPSDDEEEEEIF